MPLSGAGRFLVIAGLAMAAIGLVLIAAGRLGLGRLPGDLILRGRSTTVYFPLATSLLASLVLSLVLWLLAGRR